MDNISIIIRNKDEAEFIGFAIQSCLDFFNKPEIIVMNNESSDDSIEVVQYFNDRTDINLQNKMTRKMMLKNGNIKVEDLGVSTKCNG